MARLEMKLFGEMEVSLDGQLVQFPTQKAKELWAYLVLHRKNAHPRAQLAALLWPDSDEERAKANLRQTLTRLRRALGETECLRFSGGAVQFHFSDFWCDVLEFERALSDFPTESTLALYRGPFLAGVYEDWALIEQERLQTLYLEALEKLAQVYAERRDHDHAIKTWQRILREIAWHEQAHRQLIELYALTGDRSAALRQYEKYAEVVRRELNAEPLPEMRALSEQLARGIFPSPMPEQARVREIPFVGRERELKTLGTLWQDVLCGHSHAVLISGEVGVGKTRLVEHFLEHLPLTLEGERGHRGEGACLLRGAAYADAPPYDPILQAVRNGLKKISDETLVQLPTLWLSELAQFVPELHERFPDLKPNLPSPQGKSRWFAALTGLFELFSRERPVALFLDDLHWADSATLEYLSHLIAHIKAHRILLIGTYRVEEAHEGSLLRTWLDRLPRDCAHILTLLPLFREETDCLLKQLFHQYDNEVLDTLYTKAEGNPLFVKELTRSLLASGTLHRDPQGTWRVTTTEISVPEGLKELVQISLRRVPRRAYCVLNMAAIAGRSFALPTLKESLHQPEEALLDRLDDLRSLGLIVEHEGRYRFSHELVRQVVYDELSTDRRRLWHRRVGEALETLYAESLDELSGELAEHFRRAQLWEKAITYAMRAGAHAQKIYAYGEAKNFFKKALELFKHAEARLPLSDRLKHLKLELLQRYTGRGVFPTVADIKPALAELETAITEMMDLAIALKDETQLCEAYQRLARIRIAQNRWDAVREARLKALDIGYQWIQKQPPGEGVSSMLETTAELNKQLYRYGAALNDYQRAAEIWVALGNAYRQGVVLGLMATMQLSVGKLAEARQSAEQALGCLHRGDPHRQASILNNLGLILREMRRWQDVQACYERALALMQESKDPRGIGIVLINLGALHNDQGDYTEALRYLEQALKLLEQEGTRGLEVELCSEIGRAYLGLGHLPLALEYSTRSVSLIEEHQGFVTDEYSFYFRHYQVLQACEQTDHARAYLQKAYEELQSVAAKIHEEDFRKSFLGNIQLHREIVQAWEAAQRTRRGLASY